MEPSPDSPDWRAALDRLEGAYAPATLKGYRADVAAFVDWCAAEGRQSLPASVETVCRFLDAQARDVTSATVRRRLYGIRKIHRLLDLPDPTPSETVNLALRRVRRARPARPRQARGLTRDFLARFIAVQPDTAWGLRNKAMLSLGYDLLARRSELVALETGDLTWRPDGTLRVLIRRAKNDPFGDGRLAFSSRRSAELVDRWLDYRGLAFGPLFCPIYHGKPLAKSLSATTVKRVIRSAALEAGLDPSVAETFSGHSLRIGAAQDLLALGHDTATIMRAGGWKSIAVLVRYLEHAEANPWLAGDSARLR